MLRIIVILVLSMLLISCGKEEIQKPKSETDKSQTQDSSEDDSDSTMTVEEAFSTALVQDIIGDQEDPDLQVYLEEQIYPLVSKSEKVTIDKISSSLYLLSYSEGGTQKNLLIQKFYNPVNDEIVFEKSETDLSSKRQFVK